MSGIINEGVQNRFSTILGIVMILCIVTYRMKNIVIQARNWKLKENIDVNRN